MVVVGGLLDFGGGALAEPVMSLLYAGSIVAWFLAARMFGARAAVLTAVVLLPTRLRNPLPRALVGRGLRGRVRRLVAAVVRVLRAPSLRGFALVGAGVGILALVRPGNQVLLVLVLLPLRAARRVADAFGRGRVPRAGRRLDRWLGIHNGLRYDNYTLARGGNATVPFFRAFVTDKIVRPSNGPASRELAAPCSGISAEGAVSLVRDHARRVLQQASPRMQGDLLALSDRLKGWHSNYRWLRDVGIEAVAPIRRRTPAASPGRSGGC